MDKASFRHCFVCHKVALIIIFLLPGVAWANKNKEEYWPVALEDYQNTERFIAEKVDCWIIKAEHSDRPIEFYLRALVEIEKERLRRGK